MSSLAAIRQAYRYVVAYERRVLDAIAVIDESARKLGFEFERWEPLYRSMVTKKFSASQWAWDMVPLYAAEFRWCLGGRVKNEPGAVWIIVEHVADTAFESATRRAEPDPLVDLATTDTSDSLVRVQWVVQHDRISDELWNTPRWSDVLPKYFDSSLDTIWPRASTSQPVTTRKGALTVGSHVMSVEQLQTRDDLVAKLVRPAIDALKLAMADVSASTPRT